MLFLESNAQILIDLRPVSGFQISSDNILNFDVISPALLGQIPAIDYFDFVTDTKMRMKTKKNGTYGLYKSQLWQ
jgi:hypothetical protein